MILTKGTVESVVVDITDLTGEISDLGLTGPIFDVLDQDSNYMYQNEPVNSINDMRLFCLVDTSTWDVGIYRLYVSFTQAPETPKLGPFKFGLVA